MIMYYHHVTALGLKKATILTLIYFGWFVLSVDGREKIIFYLGAIDNAAAVP